MDPDDTPSKMPAPPRDGCIITRASLDDLPDLMDIERTCFQEDQFSEALYLSFLLRPDSEVYIYRSPAGTIGSLVLLFQAERDRCQVVSVAVHPGSQRTGLGRELMQFAETRAHQRDCAQIQLEVRKTNATARRLYERLKYRESKTLRDYYGDGLDGILYIKKLT